MNRDSGSSGDKRDVLRITEEMLNNEATADAERKLEEAKRVPLVREIGTPEKTGGTGKAIAWMFGAGVVGGLVTWIVWRAIFPIFENDEDSTNSNLFAAVSLAVVVGLVLVIGDVLRASAYSKFPQRIGIGIAAAVIAGLGLGLIANSLYGAGTERIIDDLVASGLDVFDDEFWEEFLARNQLNRGIAWAIIGLAAGATVGVASLQWKRALITGGGGLLGGFIGGYLFDAIPTEGAAQIIGLLITGLAIGGVIALTEQAVKSAWIEITHGGMAGKQFILYQSRIVLGSSPSADITLIKDPDIPPVAAVIDTSGASASVIAQDPTVALFVNGIEASSAVLRDGDSISVGRTAVKYRERGNSAVNSGVVRS